ncbi:Transcription cofactor vestigial-like protein 2 [Heterocephalus glaber]|uniref:Transcription cofactor vestigial-like protein 2 n=1 Tax=Heterocephalus glaber TaxID=10181 RepID=G5BYB4_HETGA|nr:Transcription cofactor vestigial-like protein 2 [Heterocephalus glaber]
MLYVQQRALLRLSSAGVPSAEQRECTVQQGDISSVVDEHLGRALSQPSSYSPSCASSKAGRSAGPWRLDATRSVVHPL